MRGGWRSGAGRPGWHAKTSGKHQIDVRRLHRDGYLSASLRMTWRWEDGATIGLATSPDAVTLTYRYKDREGEWRDVSQRVSVTRTPCHYGNTLPWFACPRCSRRVAILYLWNVPVCRKCARLVYASQSDDEVGRSWARTQKIERRLAGGAEKWNYIRPKGIRTATWERLMATDWREEKLRDAAFVAGALRMLPDLLG